MLTLSNTSAASTNSDTVPTQSPQLPTSPGSAYVPPGAGARPLAGPGAAFGPVWRGICHHGLEPHHLLHNHLVVGMIGSALASLSC